MYLLKLKVLIPFNNKNMLILRAYSTDNIMKKVYSPECPTIGRTVGNYSFFLFTFNKTYNYIYIILNS